MLNIIYQDDDFVAINKPAGLLVHRSNIDRHETRFAVQLLRDQLGRHVFPVHRLDKPTSGVLLFALNSEAARAMSAVFMNEKVTKRYLAIVRGYTDESGVIDYPLQERFDKMTDTRADSNKSPQMAVTRFRTLGAVELPIAAGRYQSCRYSLVLLQPETGRKHQLRRHFKHIFHPIVGDTTHGDGSQNQVFREHFNCHRLLLAAVSLRFRHPLTERMITIDAPPGSAFAGIMVKLGWLKCYSDIFNVDPC